MASICPSQHGILRPGIDRGKLLIIHCIKNSDAYLFGHDAVPEDLRQYSLSLRWCWFHLSLIGVRHAYTARLCALHTSGRSRLKRHRGLLSHSCLFVWLFLGAALLLDGVLMPKHYVEGFLLLVSPCWYLTDRRAQGFWHFIQPSSSSSSSEYSLPSTP